METVTDALSTLGVLALPIVAALLFEEILFGGPAQLLFAPRVDRHKGLHADSPLGGKPVKNDIIRKTEGY